MSEVEEAKENVSFFNKTIERISPVWALHREAALQQLNAVRRLDAASKSSRLGGWFTPEEGPNTNSRRDNRIVRARTRDLYFNNSWYHKAVKILTSNVIGKGLTPKVFTEEKSNNRRDHIQKAFKDWFGSKEFDYEGKIDGYAMMRLAYMTRIVGGEVLLRKHITRSGLKLQVLEPDFIDDTKDGITLDNGGYIQQGIEYSKKGVVVAYWLYDTHPSEYFARRKYTSSRVDVRFIIHFYKQDRPGQGRGLPLGTQILTRLFDLDLFQDAELKKNQIASLLAGFRTTTTDLGSSTPATSSGERKEVGLYPGTIKSLAAGEDIKFTNPPQHQMYPEYVRTILMEIAAAFGLTYEMLSGDLSKTNFSSSRMGWVESARFFKVEQEDFSDGVLNPIFSAWLEAHYLLTGRNTQNTRVKWHPPHREMFDPSKEIKAFAEAKNENILPLSYIWQSLGHDPDEMIEAIRETQEKMIAAGIITIPSANDDEQDSKDDKQDEADPHNQKDEEDKEDNAKDK